MPENRPAIITAVTFILNSCFQDIILDMLF